ncbi:hypothetical protein ABH920_000328 [Catenulispora sp. EB89]
MIAVALGLLSLVVMIATGVAASSTADDHLTFLGVGVQTTTAQVFLTGAIFGWAFVIALWLLRLGMHRSGQRCAQLAARRSRRASEWLGFSEGDADGDGWGGWGEWDDWRAVGRRSGNDVRGSQTDGVRFRVNAPLGGKGALSSEIVGRGEVRGPDSRGVRFRANAPLDGKGALSGEIVGRGEVRGPDSRGVCFRSAAPLDAEGALSNEIVGRGEAHGPNSRGVGFDAEGTRTDGVVRRSGAAGHGRGAPWRADGGADQANRAVAGASDQPGVLGGGHAAGPVAGRLPGLGVDGGAERRQVGGGSGPVAGEDRGAEGE